MRCIYGYEANVNATLTVEGWSQFLGASSIATTSAGSEAVKAQQASTAFQAHAGGTRQDTSCLSLDGFIQALAAISLVKYPSEQPRDAARRLLQEYLLPYCKLIGGHSTAAASAAERGGEVVVGRVRDFVISSGNAEELASIFTAYSTPQPSTGDTISAERFLRLCHDAHLMAENTTDAFTFEDVQRVFIAGAVRDETSWLRSDQFLPALVELAKAKFPTQDPYTAAVRLIVGFVLPFAQRV